jgi:hypothetical protein
MAGLQITDIIGDHAIEPAHAVFARELDFGTLGPIVNAAAGDQNFEFSAHVAKIRCGYAPL